MFLGCGMGGVEGDWCIEVFVVLNFEGRVFGIDWVECDMVWCFEWDEKWNGGDMLIVIW